MASYRRDADANRNALFGSSTSSSSSRPTPKSSNLRNNSSAPPSSHAVPSSSLAPIPLSSKPNRRSSPITNALTGQARTDKLNEAQDYQKKAKKALQKSLFSSPDPVSAALFYHRAAEAYKQCGGEDRLERLHRVAGAECHMSHGAYAIAAGDYVRAAELMERSSSNEEEGTMTMEEKRRECHDLYENASKAWREEVELGRAAECLLQSGFALLMRGGGEEEEEDDSLIVLGGQRLMGMNRNALEAIESAVESHVPDPLNRYQHFRQTGVSMFTNPEEAATISSKDDDHNDIINDETRSMCLAHMVKSSFAHETVARAMEKLAEYGEYKSALYAAGAVTALLENDGFSTISLSRAYCAESILALAIGDVVAADKYFLEVHLQNNNYLSSRECKLAEDLIRAVKMRNDEDLELARNPNGENRSALSNLSPMLRNVVATLRISGVAKSMASYNDKVAVVEAGTVPQVPDSTAYDTTEKMRATTDENLDDELDDLMKDMGLASDNEQNDDDDDDDDVDLR